MAVQLVGKRFEHILEDDRDSETPTVFFIKEMNATERTKISTAMLGISVPKGADLDALLHVGELMQGGYRKVCDIGLLSAAPILDHDGNSVDMDIKAVLDGIADPEHIKELALAVIRANHLSRAERKKSETPLKPERQD